MRKLCVFFLLFLTSCVFLKTEYTKDEIINKNNKFYSKEGELITGKVVYETEDQKIIQTVKKGNVIKTEVLKNIGGTFIRKQSFEYNPILSSKHYYDNGSLKVKKTNNSVMYYEKTGKPLLSIQWPSDTLPKEFEDVKFTCFSKDGMPKNIDKNKKEPFVKNYFDKIKLLEFEEEINLNDSCEIYAITE